MMKGDAIIIILILLPMLMGIVSYPVGLKSIRVRNALSDVTMLSVFVLTVYLLIRTFMQGAGFDLAIDGICGMGMNLTVSGLGCLYGCVASFMWAVTGIFSREYFAGHGDNNRFYVFNLMTLGSILGVFWSADLFTLFIFFEIMSFTSFVWVAHEETPEALKASYTYLTVAIIGGLVTLMGLFLLYARTGTLMIDDLPADHMYLTGGLIVFGFAVKAGVWPLHIWLPKAHPVAPAPASALLSGVLTKSGIFGILAVTAHMFKADEPWGRVIQYLGVITMFTGALLAICSDNIKRTLACSSMSQIGFIVTGIGSYAMFPVAEKAEAAMARRGIVLHMVNHSLIKLVLFMAAGVIYMNIRKLKLSEIRGFGRNKLILKICFAIGAASISGIPLTSGYISKTLLHESITSHVVGAIFLLSGGMTLCYMLKLFITVFIEQNEDPTVQEEFDNMSGYMNPATRIVLLIPAVILLIMGLVPYPAMSGIYTPENLGGALISVSTGVILYMLILRRRTLSWPTRLDLEELIYRPVLMKILPGAAGFVSALLSQMTDALIIIFRMTSHRQISTHIDTGSLDDHLAVEAGKVLDKYIPNRNGTSHIPGLVEKEEHAARTQRVISSSLSFGLILVCIGLILTLIYILSAS